MSLPSFACILYNIFYIFAIANEKLFMKKLCYFMNYSHNSSIKRIFINHIILNIKFWSGFMSNTSFNSLRCKEVVNIRDGCRLGYIDDIIFDTESGTICEIEVPRRGKLFGFLSKSETICIPWHAIERIGDDIIIVSWEIVKRDTVKIGFLEAISNWLNQ